MRTVADYTRQLAAALKARPAGARTLKFDFRGDGVIHIHGDACDNEDRPADCTLRIAKADLDAALAGEIDPSAAVRDGRLEVIGDPAAALDLQSTLMAAWLAPRG